MVEQPSQVRDPVEVLAEEFLERRRRGEVPSLKEYIDRYPHLADEIRDVFPAVVMMDEVDPPSAELARTLGGLSAPHGRLGFRQLGDFRILREVGQGGMGIVYEATQESLGRHVALKVLPPSACQSRLFRERFQREACAAARLHHTNIVPIFGVGEDQGVLYYAMQFIQGQALDAVLEDVKHMRGGVGLTTNLSGQPTLARPEAEAARSLISGHFAAAESIAGQEGLPKPPAFADVSSISTHSDLRNQPEHSYYRSIAWLGVQAAEGLAYAHSQGIWHRDIKPANLLLDAQGTLWVTDFGLAKTEGGEDLTHTGEMVGTLRYMAPERFQGKGDARSDIYALGVTLYEMLTLSPPFNGTDRVALVGQITQDDPPPPSRLAPHLPCDLETIVQKAMARDPAARYGSARELADDLRRFLENRSIKARRSSAAERLRRWCRRNPAVASLMAFVALLLVVIAAGSFFSAVRLGKELDRAEHAEKDKTDQLWQSYLDRARAQRYSRQAGQRFDSLDALAKAAHIRPDPKLRDEVIAALALPDLRPGKAWKIWPAGSIHLVFEGAYQRYARADDKGNVTIRNLADDREIRSFPSRGRKVERLLLSPDGRFLGVGIAGRPGFIWNLDTGQVVLKERLIEWAWSISPDSRKLAMWRSDETIAVFDLTTSKETQHFQKAGRPQTLAFAPNGRQLAVAYQHAPFGTKVYDLASGDFVAGLPGKSVWSLAWHPDSQRLALGTDDRDRRVYVWDMPARRIVATMESHTQPVVEVAFHPSGDLLASGSWDGTVRLWNPATGRLLLTYVSYYGLHHFSPDGKHLGYVREGSAVRLMEINPGLEYRTLVSSLGAGQGEYAGLDVSPDGRLLAVGMDDGLRLWELAGGRELTHLRQGPTISALFAPDGSELLTCGSSPLRRWPIRPALSLAPLPAGERGRGEGSNELRIGPPRQIWLPVAPHSAYRNCDGRTLAIPSEQAGVALIVDLNKEAVQGRWLAHPMLNGAILSPDGQWLVTAGHHSPDIKVWNVRNRQVVKELPKEGGTHCYFSPDGKVLINCRADECCFWDVASWQPLRHLARTRSTYASPAAFTADSRLVALELAPAVIHLVDVASGRTLAKLEDPNHDRATALCFTPDGSRLITLAGSSHAAHIWDLRAIRAQLAKLGLDWDAPPYPAATGNLPTTPLRILVDKGKLDSRSDKRPDEQRLRALLAAYTLQAACAPYHPEPYHERGHVYDALGQFKSAVQDYTRALRWQPPDSKRQAHLYLSRAGSLMCLHQDAEAAADLHKVIELDPTTPLPFNNLAQIYVNGPAELRDPAKALAIAAKGLEVAPGDWYCRNTLGVAHYRLGHYEAAVVALERSLRESKGERAAFQLYFLAMCYARLGDAVKAHECYDQAVRWVPEQPRRLPPGWRKRLESMRAEADAVLTGKAAEHRQRRHS